MQRHRRLAVRLALVTLLTTATIFFVSTGAVYFIVHGILLEQAQTQAHDRSQTTAARISGMQAEVAAIARTLVRTMEITPPDPHALFPKLEAIIGASDNIQGAAVSFEPYTVDPEQRYFSPFSYQRDGAIERMWLGDENFDYFIRDWYQIPVLTGQGYWTDPFISAAAADRLIVTYAEPLRTRGGDSNGNGLLGILSMDIELSVLTQRVDELRIFETGHAFLLSPSMRVIAHPLQDDWIMRETLFSLADTEGQPELRTLGRRMQREHEGFIPAPGLLTEEPAYLYFMRLPDLDWTLAMIIPERELFGDVLRVIHWFLLIGAVGFIVLLGGTILIARRITQPIKGLVRYAGEIARGNLDRPLPSIRTEDEIGQLAHSFDEMRLSLKDYINNLTATTAAKERIESELKIARNIQMSFLPRRLDLSGIATGIDLHANLLPARAVGGDLFDFFPMGSNKRLFFAVGDVSDKGVPAALFMAVTKTLVKGIAEQESDPGQLLARVNNELCVHNENTMFVTYVCGMLDLHTGELWLANAGHNPPVWLDRSGQCSWLPLPPGLVLGAMEDMEYTVTKYRMQPGDGILLYTDGVTEAFNGAGEAFGEDRLIALCKEQPEREARPLVERVFAAVQSFAADAEQADDITVLALRYNAPDV